MAQRKQKQQETKNKIQMNSRSEKIIKPIKSTKQQDRVHLGLEQIIATYLNSVKVSGKGGGLPKNLKKNTRKRSRL